MKDIDGSEPTRKVRRRQEVHQIRTGESSLSAPERRTDTALTNLAALLRGEPMQCCTARSSSALASVGHVPPVGLSMH